MLEKFNYKYFLIVVFFSMMDSLTLYKYFKFRLKYGGIRSLESGSGKLVGTRFGLNSSQRSIPDYVEHFLVGNHLLRIPLVPVKRHVLNEPTEQQREHIIYYLSVVDPDLDPVRSVYY